MAQAEAVPLRQRRLGLPLACPSGGALPELLLVCTQMPTSLLDPALPAAFEACVRQRLQVRLLCLAPGHSTDCGLDLNARLSC